MAAENIFQAYAQAPKSVIEYGADLDRRDLLQQQLQGQIRQNSIADLTAAQTRDTLAQSAAGRNAIQSVYQNLSPTATIEELTSKLRATGNQDAIAHADEREKAASGIAAQKALAFKDTQQGNHFSAQSTGLTQDQSIKAHSEHLKALQGVSSPQEMDQWLRSGVGAGALDLTKAANVSATLQQDPSQFAALRQQMLDTGVDIQERFKQGQETARSTATNATSVATNAATNATSRANNASTQAGENARAESGHANALKMAGINPDGSMSSDMETTAKAIANGQLPPPTGMALLNPRNQRVLARVMEINPQYDATTVSAKKAAATAFTTGPQGNALRSVSTANEHLNQLGELIDAMDNGNMQVVNRVGNYFSEKTGDPKVTNVRAIANVVGQEVVKAIVANSGSVSERDAAAAAFGTDKSTAQLKGATQKYRMVMGAQADNLLAQRDAAGLPRSTLPTYNNGATQASGANVVMTPDGVPHTFPNPAAAASFKKAAGL